MGTSAAESLNAAGNIFIGQSESPLLIRPFIKDMTSSELHAVCTGGFATIAGSVMAAYILYGVIGASQSIKLVANIAVNLIAFIAILEFVNTTLTWFGARVGLEEPGYENLTFQLICSYLFWPVAFLMGVEMVDCRKVAELIGVKTFVNEFVAYTELSVYINNQKNLTWYEGLVNTTSNSTNLTYTGAWYYNKGDIVYNDLNITLVGGLLQVLVF
ncbi:hypothetical protein KUTeg_008839 [Tegillarca granosa]|uniref:Uncharacterized protein n=1 Tax=Tegillarca granosa TaxID=220873 RepID=A0ABQ9FF36_TEGGR|nr:hypothetical protein KUTeg_008839 [Tegillarca granosa]